MRKKIFVTIALSGILTVFVWAVTKSYKKEENSLETTGVIEATEVNLSSKIFGRMEWICCKEGDRIESGKVAIMLDGKELKAKVSEAEASLRSAEAAYENARAGVESARANLAMMKANIANAEADLQRVKVRLKDAEKDLIRAKELLAKKIIPESQKDDAQTRYEEAAAELRAAEARLRLAREQYRVALAQLNSAQSLERSTKAQVEQAKATLTLAKVQLQDTIIRSPISGIVMMKAFEEGEIVNPGVPILTIVDLDYIWARIDLEETWMDRVKLGAPATVILEGSDNDKAFPGKIIEIGEEGGFATQRDVRRGRQDIKTFRVKVWVPNHQRILKPGMTVLVRLGGS